MRTDESDELVRPSERDVDSRSCRLCDRLNDSVIVGPEFDALEDTASSLLTHCSKPGPCSLCREINTHVSHNHALSTHLRPGASHYIASCNSVCHTLLCNA